MFCGIIDTERKKERGKTPMEKIDFRHHYLVGADTETCNTINDENGKLDMSNVLVYDLGLVACDTKGRIYEEISLVIKEIFYGMKDLMQSAYFAEKIPNYWEDIKNGTREIKSIFNIRKQLHKDMKDFGVKKVGAYNMGFDKRALNNIIRYCSKSLIRWFFPFGTDFFCIWSMACQVVMNSTSYVKFALQNGLVSEKDNLQTSAECCYRFLKKQIDFIESHTGLEDVRIEVEIMAKCFSTHKKMDKKINSACWRLPQKKRKELDLREVFA
jgi:hypothetical protein